MNSLVATHEASNKRHPRNCKGELRQVRRGKYKGKIEARHKREKKEFGVLIAENNYLKEIIEQLIAQYSQVQVPATDLQEQENLVSQSLIQVLHPNFYDKGEEGMDSNLVGTSEEELDDGIGLDDLDDPLP